MKNWFLPALASCAFALPALGQEARPAAALPPAILFSQIQPGGTLGHVAANAGRLFRDLDADGDGKFDAADIELDMAITIAGTRAATLMRIMSSDLNADGVVTEAELRTRQRHEQRRNDPGSGESMSAQATRNAAQIREAMAADTDGDGRITAAEAAALGATQAARDNRASHGPARHLREFAEYAGASGLTAAQFVGMAIDLFKAVDSDSNGTISQDEFAALRKRAEERQRIAAMAEKQRRDEEARAGCALPKPSAAAGVVLLSAYEGDALSTTTIGSQDVEVRTASIEVEAGNGPLYVVALSFRPMIWRFSGAVERLERVVLASQSTQANGSRPGARPIAGASGIAADKVAFLPKPICLSYFSESPSIEAARTIGMVRSETGKDPVVASRYSVSGIAIPSATLQPLRKGAASGPGLVFLKGGQAFSVDTGSGGQRIKAIQNDIESGILSFYPGGVVDIDPATVVASDKPSPYEVLPSQAGLLQLTRSGALSRNRNGEFLIKEKIRFPSGLYGAYSVRFLLLRGVPEPEGDPGHSCVFSEETGKPLAGVRSGC